MATVRSLILLALATTPTTSGNKNSSNSNNGTNNTAGNGTKMTMACDKSIVQSCLDNFKMDTTKPCTVVDNLTTCVGNAGCCDFTENNQTMKQALGPMLDMVPQCTYSCANRLPWDGTIVAPVAPVTPVNPGNQGCDVLTASTCLTDYSAKGTTNPSALMDCDAIEGVTGCVSDAGCCNFEQDGKSLMEALAPVFSMVPQCTNRCKSGDAKPKEPAPPPPPGSCTDESPAVVEQFAKDKGFGSNQTCASGKMGGLCSAMKDDMTRLCNKTCEFCCSDESATKVAASMQDMGYGPNMSCTDAKNAMVCSTKKEEAANICPLTCGICKVEKAYDGIPYEKVGTESTGVGCPGYKHMESLSERNAGGQMNSIFDRRGDVTVAECALAVQKMHGKGGCRAQYFFFETGGYCNCPTSNVCDEAPNMHAGAPGTLYKFSQAFEDPPCDKDSLHDCSKEQCTGTIDEYGTQTALSWKDGYCQKCGKYSMWGCTATSCPLLKLDDNKTAGWVKDRHGSMQCKECGRCEAEGCTTEQKCMDAKTSCKEYDGKPKDTGIAWEGGKCRACSKDNKDGCTEENCLRLNLTQPYHDAGYTIWPSWKDGSCQECASDRTWGCTEDLCNALTPKSGTTVGWKDGSCKRCGECESDGCTTQETCKNSAVKHDKASGITYSCGYEANLINGRCQRCSECQVGGCNKTSCSVEKQSCSYWGDNIKLGWDDTKGCTRCDEDSVYECGKDSCRQLQLKGAIAVWDEKSCYCKKCSAYEMHNCDEEACGKLDGANWVLNHGYAHCQKCSRDDLGGCNTKVSCEAIGGTWFADRKMCRDKPCEQDPGSCITQQSCESNWGNSGEFLARRNEIMARHNGIAFWHPCEGICTYCSKCNPEQCSTKETCALVISMPANKDCPGLTTVWKDNRCQRKGKCSEREMHYCSSKEECEQIKESESRGKDWQGVWIANQGRCEMMQKGAKERCGGKDSCEIDGCKNKTACESAAQECYRGKQGGKGVWREGRCEWCDKHSMYNCPEEDCTAAMAAGTDDDKTCSGGSDSMTYGFSRGYCQRCGGDEYGGCKSKAACEGLKLSWGTTTWNPSKKTCEACGAHSREGCKTEAQCNSLSTHLKYGTSALFTCGECTMCGDGDTRGCNTKEKCMNQNLACSYDMVPTFNETTGKCRNCWEHDPSGCTTQESCTQLAQAHPERNIAWVAGMQQCARCDKDDYRACTTKEMCTAASSSGVWDETSKTCDRCGDGSVGGCKDKMSCEAVTSEKSGMQAIWMGTFCHAGCSADDWGFCNSKAACDGLGHSKISWDAAKGACINCETKKTRDVADGCFAAEVCRTQPQAIQAHCAVHRADCAWHCKGNAGECSLLGITAAGQDMPLDDSGNVAGVVQPVTVEVKTTTFDVKVNVEKAVEFDDSKYLQQMASETGVPAAEVEITKKEFVVEVGFKFTADKPVTKTSATKAIAKAWAVTESEVEVTINARRRLDAGRRLAVDTSVTARMKTQDAAKADQVKVAAATTETVAAAVAELKVVANVDAQAVVEQQPKVEVKVTTKVKSEKAVVKPSAQKMKAIAVAAGGEGATAEIDSTTWKETTQTVLSTKQPSLDVSGTTAAAANGLVATMMAMLAIVPLQFL